ncbi:MAG: nucleotide exchange factor GrpE [Oscillospiraceae bacterium]
MSENEEKKLPDEELEPEILPEPEETKSKKEPKEPKKPKKEKTFTLTREEMEKAELAAKQLASAQEQFLRLTAEYDNYRKRTAKEKESIYEDAKLDTIQKFLAVYDNLQRAAAIEDATDSPHKKGLDMIFQQFCDVLTALDVTEIAAAGQPFDPEKHNAVMHIEDESLGENMVADVFQTGFMLGDRVLRFATVRVAN